MSDVNRRQYEHWYADACRKAELIGGITAYVNAARDDDAPFPLNPEQAITHIGDLLDAFDRPDTGEVGNP